jgi:drug/metabolite transporter (DMT)-like permease
MQTAPNTIQLNHESRCQTHSRPAPPDVARFALARHEVATIVFSDRATPPQAPWPLFFSSKGNPSMSQHKKQLSGAYLGVILIWSTTPLGIVWSSQGIHYTFPLFTRMAIGLVVSLLWLSLTRTRFPLDAQARQSYAIAGFSIWAAMLCTYWGARFIPSGMISVIFGLSPIMTGLFAWLWLREDSFSPLKIIGMMLGLAGLSLVFGGSMQLGAAAHWGIAAVLAAVALQAWGLVAVKRIKADVPAVAQTAGALAFTVPLSGLSLIMLGEWPAHVPARAAAATLYLGVFGSVAGFSLYYFLIKHISAGRVALITLITPVTALMLGIMLNGERLTLNIAEGTVMILFGLALYEWGLLSKSGQRLRAARLPD